MTEKKSEVTERGLELLKGFNELAISMFFLRQNTIISREIADAFQPHICVCVLDSLHRDVATTDIMIKYFDWAMKTSHMWPSVVKQTWHLLRSRRVLIYEHGIKSTNFPQACWTRSMCFYELYGSGLDDCLSNSSSAWVIIHTHAMCRKL